MDSDRFIGKNVDELIKQENLIYIFFLISNQENMLKEKLMERKLEKWECFTKPTIFYGFESWHSFPNFDSKHINQTNKMDIIIIP